MTDTIHVLLNGRPLCGFAPDLFPGQWPAGHRWVAGDQAGAATCEGCTATPPVWRGGDVPKTQEHVWGQGERADLRVMLDAANAALELANETTSRATQRAGAMMEDRNAAQAQLTELRKLAQGVLDAIDAGPGGLGTGLSCDAGARMEALRAWLDRAMTCASGHKGYMLPGSDSACVVCAAGTGFAEPPHADGECMAAELERLRLLASRLHDACEEYGVHKPRCGLYRGEGRVASDCTCGLFVALEGAS
jgi:hypothetical protein